MNKNRRGYRPGKGPTMGVGIRSIAIAYTLGHREIYDRVLVQRSLQGKPMLKLGAKPGYSGGWVWRTALEATLFGQRYNHFAVYVIALRGTWGTDVSVIPADDRVHRLLVDAEILGRHLPPIPAPMPDERQSMTTLPDSVVRDHE